MRAGRVARMLFGFGEPVSRGAYAVAGFGLTVLKVGVDLLVLYVDTGRLYAPWELLSLVRVQAGGASGTAALALMIWALPFAWIGLSMTVRRAIDAGLSPWMGLLFCVPVGNLLLMLLLCLLPGRPPRPGRPTLPDHPSMTALRAVGLSLIVAVPITLVSVLMLDDFGMTLFAGTPLGMGVVAGFAGNRGEDRGCWWTVAVACTSMLVAALGVALFAVEGLLCIAMALPLALPLAIAGALAGRGVARLRPRVVSPLLILILVLPVLAWAEPVTRGPLVHRVTTSVLIQASPEVVWRNVIAFEPIPDPVEPWFRAGIAYPTSARIDGRGAGATRYCTFSTGSFVEPITAWEAPRRLAFDVAGQPDPLTELSPWPSVLADHREASIVSRRGEFLLEPAGQGRTWLRGTTWYTLALHPEPYWALWSDALIGSIHTRVLRHIKSQAEQG